MFGFSHVLAECRQFAYNPLVTLQDFIERLYSQLRKEPERPLAKPLAAFGTVRAVVQAIEQAPLFLLGEGDDLVRAIVDLHDDLVEDLADGLMAPFPNIAIAYELKSGWVLHWLHRLGTGERGDRFVYVAFDEKHRVPGFLQAIEFEFGGKKDGEFQAWIREETLDRYWAIDRGRTTEDVARDVAKIVNGTLFDVALISHPAHYIVERTPALSAREERQVARGEPRPARKRPHFLVIDHEELVELNPKTRTPAGTHRSPVPHARRGHWMRLSEKCHRARAEGRTKTWVRETYVGEREFEDGKNQYRVLLAARELIGNAGSSEPSRTGNRTMM